jgi:branched-chain amino acid transport system substrate-binding protein
MIKGFEALEMTDDKMAALGLAGFGPSFSVSCENHGGDGMVAVAQWDAGAGKWSIVSDYQPSDMSVIQPLIDADSGAFASENNLTPNCN